MVSFQVLTCGANGSGISSMICLEHTLNNQVKVVNQILVNVGDGTQRFCSEHKIKLDKVSCIVFSSLSPANISGFQGIFLALSDLEYSKGKEKLTLCGPPGLKLIVDLMIPLINRRYPTLEFMEIQFESELPVVGGVLKFQPVFSSKFVIAIATTLCPAPCEVSSPEKNHILFYPVPCYFHVTPTFESVLSSKFHKLFMVCFVPLTSSSLFDATIMSGLEELCKIYSIFGIMIKNELNQEVIEFPQAQILIAAYSKICHPLFPKVHLPTKLNWNSTEEFKSGTLLVAFPLLLIRADERCLCPVQDQEEVPTIKLFHTKADQLCTFVDQCYKFLLGLNLIDLCDGETLSQCKEVIVPNQYKTTSEMLDKLIATGKMGTVSPPNPFNDVFQIVFLGTGSSRPSKYRSNSCILLTFLHNPTISLLLDVGEGAMTQLFQSVSGNLERYYNLLLSVKVIWISHHHGDHSAGFIQFLHCLQRAIICVERSGFDKVLVIAPDLILKYYEFIAISCGCEDFFSFQSITRSIFAGLTSEISQVSLGLITRLQSIEVQHCYQSYGVVIELYTGQKVVYSGDCRPSQSLAFCGMNCDLLIHEATFDDDKSIDALNKKHCTLTEALNVCRRMKAKHCILTHFSQRYPLLSNLSLESFATTFDSVGLAVDCIRFSFPSQMANLRSATLHMSQSLKTVVSDNPSNNEGKNYNDTHQAN